jgi:hypothetical protein
MVRFFSSHSQALSMDARHHHDPVEMERQRQQRGAFMPLTKQWISR